MLDGNAMQAGVIGKRLVSRCAAGKNDAKLPARLLCYERGEANLISRTKTAARLDENEVHLAYSVWKDTSGFVFHG